jgi:hypothetical protein
MSQTRKYEIIKLKSDNYLIWANAMKLQLQVQKCWSSVIFDEQSHSMHASSSSSKAEESSEEGKLVAEDNDVKARSIIFSSLEESHQLKLMQLTSARQYWEALKPRGGSEQASRIKNDIQNCKLANFSTIELFLESMYKKFLSLQNIAEGQDMLHEHDLCIQILSNLSGKFQVERNMLMMMSDSAQTKFTFDYIQTWLKSMVKRDSDSAKSVPSKAYQVNHQHHDYDGWYYDNQTHQQAYQVNHHNHNSHHSRPRGHCYICQDPSHYADRCPERRRGKGKGKGKGKRKGQGKGKGKGDRSEP